MSNKTEELLLIGSIVLLKEGLQKLMIVGRGTIYTDQETSKDTFADYMAVLYPTGLNPETTIFFNHENIDQVVFRGYSDEEELRFLEVYEEWKKNLENSSKKEQQSTETFGF
ncbi:MULTISPECIES: DUF4176 domain-containing protein [Enterococcus]|uniref:DUF4176 domain-containing protein n=1 Tax=Enterococcus TaxID=1350 RepID=UPI0007C17FA4|nr:DUF4176 domain-containing protein [Enterococcus hirae]AND72866.1 hypothetical protein A6P53_08385 [Enterococcus hirae]